MITSLPPEDVLGLNDLLDTLAVHDHTAADLVKLRCFAGLTLEQAADSLGLARTTAYRKWTYAKAWLFARMQGQDDL
jgi:hypothetical protein